MSRGSFQPQLLDIDEKIFDRNLRIVDMPEEHEALLPFRQSREVKEHRSLLPGPDLPGIQVTPEAGICVKTKNISGKKVFINLCKIQEIPPPPPITEEKLKEIISSDDYTSDYRVPMSLGAPREEKDKSGGNCLSADVAVNSAWFEDTMENSLVFTTFTINVAMEGLCEKYGEEVNLDRQNWTILRNKKYMGALQRHHIQQRAKGSKIKEIGTAGSENQGINKQESLVKVVQGNSTATASKKFTNSREVVPKYKLMIEPKTSDIPDLLLAELELPGVYSARELTLDIGEDRIVLEGRRAGYLLDVFVAFTIDQSRCSARFDKEQQRLFITMPLLK